MLVHKSDSGYSYLSTLIKDLSPKGFIAIKSNLIQGDWKSNFLDITLGLDEEQQPKSLTARYHKAKAERGPRVQFRVYGRQEQQLLVEMLRDLANRVEAIVKDKESELDPAFTSSAPTSPFGGELTNATHG